MMIGDNIIHNDEHMSIGILPDVLFDIDGGYHKMTDDDINLGKFEIGKKYTNVIMNKTVTLLEDTTHVDCEGDAVIETKFDGHKTTNSSVKYLRQIKEHKYNIGDTVKFDTFVSGTGVITDVQTTGYWIETSDCSGYENVFSSKEYVTKIEPEYKRRFNVGDVVDVEAGCGAPDGTGKIVELREDNHYKVYYDDYDWFVSDDQLSLSKPKVEHKFNVGDKVRMIDDSRCNDKGTGEIVSIRDEITYEVKLVTLDTENDVPKYTLLYEQFQLELLEDDIRKLKIGDKLEFGKWKLDVTERSGGSELTLTNDYFEIPSVIKIVADSVGWFRNGNDTTIYRKEYVHK